MITPGSLMFVQIAPPLRAPLYTDRLCSRCFLSLLSVGLADMAGGVSSAVNPGFSSREKALRGIGKEEP